MRLPLKSVFYQLFSDLISENYAHEDVQLFQTIFTESYLDDALKIDAESRDYDSETARGFGDVFGNIPIDSLIILLKWLGIAVAGKITTEATTTTIYIAALDAIKNMPRSKYDALQPWTGRVETYLSKKCK